MSKLRNLIFPLEQKKARKKYKEKHKETWLDFSLQQGHNFNKHSNFITTDKLANQHGSKEEMRKLFVIIE